MHVLGYVKKSFRHRKSRFSELKKSCWPALICLILLQTLQVIETQVKNCQNKVKCKKIKVFLIWQIRQKIRQICCPNLVFGKPKNIYFTHVSDSGVHCSCSTLFPDSSRRDLHIVGIRFWRMPVSLVINADMKIGYSVAYHGPCFISGIIFCT